MTDPIIAYGAIAVIVLVTAATRFAGPLIMRGFTLNKRLERFLDAMSYSVLAAIVANFLSSGGVREALAVACAGAAMALTRSAVWGMLAGMVVAAIWTAGAG